MADIKHISGHGAKLQLKVGSLPTMNVPCVGGEGYTVGDNDVVERLSQGGAFGAAPGNLLVGLNTPILDVVARCFVPNAGAGWFHADNLLAMLGRGTAGSGDIAIRDDANGDLPLVDMSFSNGADSATDQLKLLRFSLEASGQTNQALARMTFLGLNVASAATFGAYVAAEGSPSVYWKTFDTWTWKPKGGAAAPLTLMESFAMTINTGVVFGKVNDGTDNPSSLDPLDMSGAVTIAQRAGATNRMVASRNGTLSLGILGGVAASFAFGLNRMGRPRRLNIPGGVVDATSWQMVRTDGSFCAISSV